MISSIYVESLTYWQRGAANSYFATHIHVNGALVGVLPFQYGYGQTDEVEAAQWLRANCAELADMELPLSRYCREHNIAYYHSMQGATQRDTKQFGDYKII